MLIRDMLLKHTEEHEALLEKAAEDSDLYLPKHRAISPLASRLRGMALYVLGVYALRTPGRVLLTYRSGSVDATSAVVTGLFYHADGLYPDALFAVQVTCLKHKDRPFAVKTEIVPVDSWPKAFKDIAELPDLSQPVTGISQSNGSVFQEVPTAKHRQFPASNSRTFVYDLKTPCLLQESDGYKEAIFANIVSQYADRCFEDAARTFANGAEHIWWRWRPKNWVGIGEPPFQLSFVYLLFVRSETDRLIQRIRAYCFDECDALKTFTCPQHLVEGTSVRSEDWRRRYYMGRAPSYWQKVPLLDVKLLRS